MKKISAITLAFVSAVVFAQQADTKAAVKYEAKWESLDKRPTPSWWTEAKFGIFIHWGPYAVPAYAPVLPGGRFSWDAYAEWYQGKMLAGKKAFLDHHRKVYAWTYAVTLETK